MVNSVKESILLAESETSQLHRDVLALRGMSSNKVRHFLNNIVGKTKDARYLEIGVWKGSTFISAIYKNNFTKAVAVDNFSEFGGDWDEFLANVDKYIFWNNKGDKLDLINCSFESVDLGLQKFNIYFYDGRHQEEDQYNAFTIMNKHLDDEFIAIVDDWNILSVRNGTRRAFKELNYSIVEEWEMPASRNGDKEQWWNGFYIAVVRKSKDGK